jgi:hypothetical protein
MTDSTRSTTLGEVIRGSERLLALAAQFNQSGLTTLIKDLLHEAQAKLEVDADATPEPSITDLPRHSFVPGVSRTKVMDAATRKALETIMIESERLRLLTFGRQEGLGFLGHLSEKVTLEARLTLLAAGHHSPRPEGVAPPDEKATGFGRISGLVHVVAGGVVALAGGAVSGHPIVGFLASFAVVALGGLIWFDTRRRNRF